MDEKSIIKKQLHLVEKVKTDELSPMINKIKTRIREIDVNIGQQTIDSSGNTWPLMIHCLDNTVQTTQSRKIFSTSRTSYIQENKNDMIVPNNLENERVLHQNFIDSIASNDSEFILFSLGVSLSISELEGKIFIELIREGKTYFFEIRNGYPIYLDTFNNFFELFVSGRFFQFNNSSNLASFDVLFELQYPWPVYHPKTGEVKYKNKKIITQKIHVQIP